LGKAVAEDLALELQEAFSAKTGFSEETYGA